MKNLDFIYISILFVRFSSHSCYLCFITSPPPLTNARKENAHHKICRKKCEKFAHTNRHTHYVFFSTIHLQIIIFYLQTIFPTDLTSVSGLLFERFMGRRLVICGEAWIVSIPFSITHRHLQCMWPDFANIYVMWSLVQYSTIWSILHQIIIIIINCVWHIREKNRNAGRINEMRILYLCVYWLKYGCEKREGQMRFNVCRSSIRSELLHSIQWN